MCVFWYPEPVFRPRDRATSFPIESRSHTGVHRLRMAVRIEQLTGLVDSTPEVLRRGTGAF